MSLFSACNKFDIIKLIILSRSELVINGKMVGSAFSIQFLNLGETNQKGKEKIELEKDSVFFEYLGVAK